MNKVFSNQAKWVEPPAKLNLDLPYLKGVPLRPIDDNKIEYEIVTNNGPVKVQISNDKSFMMSNGKTYEDMCNMDILNEPEVLNNLIERYKNDQIFTFIGPTLVVVNPYRVLPQYFSNEAMLKLRTKIVEGNSTHEQPHIYLIAGNAFNSMIDQEKKQAIVISGESGAGKTESTKYCMQLLTSLSHQQSHSIESKILACNPILEAFGNSKTTRNDNSSRFGKYVQIFFARDNTIVGANINSYLLEKSRVVATAEKQRNFHIFYALIASDTIKLKKPQEYKYLERSKCFEAAGLNDKEFFKEIQNSMTNIGFSEKDQSKIWSLLCSILELGNLEFDDTAHKENQSKPCDFNQTSRAILENLSKLLGVKEGDLEKILLFEKKQFLKQFTFSPYNKNKCVANTNTLSKAIYNAIFEFIIHKIQKSLKPEGKNIQDYLSINILDIFGFENFQVNSFEQFCINFTNEKLLRLYNQYVFEREMKILKEDGLDQHISSIKPPTNEAIIETFSGKVSLFSIINDNTMPIQFKDADMIHGFQNKIKSACIEFDKHNKNKFTILHSQCNVKYDIDGFKQKNQDKVLPEIADIVNNLFEHDSKDQAGKTLLVKFSKQIDDLMQELTSSNVHFIRCIKPNEKKIPRCAEHRYLLTQVRYLGVFETIQIRKKTFPSRWLYDQFLQRFESLFPLSKGSNKDKTKKIMGQLSKDPKDYLLGNQRVYMNSELQSKLSKKLHEAMKKKLESGKKIWRFYKKYKVKRAILKNLKIITMRIRMWKKIAQRYQNQIKKRAFNLIGEFATQKKEQQKKAQQKKLMESKKYREEEEKKAKEEKMQKRKVVLPVLFEKLVLKYHRILKQSLVNIKQVKPTGGSKNKISADPTATTLKSGKNSRPGEKVQQVNEDLNQTVFVQDLNGPKGYQRQIKKVVKETEFEMHQSFLNEKSILIENQSDIAFEGTLPVPFFNPSQSQGLKKLKLILADKYKAEINDKSDDFLSPQSEDSNFKLEDTPNSIMTKVLEFDSKQFFKKVLRKRTNFFGMSKDEDDILVVKNRPLSKSLTNIADEEVEKEAIKIFKQILKISEQAKIDSVFKQIEKFIFLCRNASPELINQTLLQLIKQSNTSNDLCSIRIIQALTVFLHLYDPDHDFILASLNFIFKKLTDNSFSERQSEYFRYVYKKMVRKLEKNNQIGYMPIKYQIMALMCKRMISVPLYLSIGSSCHVKVQSYQTLADVKERAMLELGINPKRLTPDFFTFFELANFSGLTEERPLKQDIVVWDLVSYWQRSIEKYAQQNESPPLFYLVLKIRYAFQCHESDEESIQIAFGQCFFDYFMGRIRLGLKQIGAMAACIKKLKFPNKEAEDYKECFPHWALSKWNEKQLTKEMCEGVLALSEMENCSEQAIKFKFVQVAQLAPLSMSLTVTTEQQVRIHFKHKTIYLSENNEIIETIPIKSITKYAEQEDKFVFSVRNQAQNRVIFTEHASICCKYMSLLQDLVTKRSKSQASNALLTNL